jgi:hypothetical protein
MPVYDIERQELVQFHGMISLSREMSFDHFRGDCMTEVREGGVNSVHQCASNMCGKLFFIPAPKMIEFMPS